MGSKSDVTCAGTRTSTTDGSMNRNEPPTVCTSARAAVRPRPMAPCRVVMYGWKYSSSRYRSIPDRVAHRQHQRVALPAVGNPHHRVRPPGDGLLGVQHQVHEHLLEVLRIQARRGRPSAVGLDVHRDARPCEVIPAQVQRAVDAARHVGDRRRLVAARVVHQLAQQARAPHGLAVDALELCATSSEMPGLVAMISPRPPITCSALLISCVTLGSTSSRVISRLAKTNRPRRGHAGRAEAFGRQ